MNGGETVARMRKSLLALMSVAILTGCSADPRAGKAPAVAPKIVETTPAPEPSKAPPRVKPELKPVAAAEPWGAVKGRIIWGSAELPKLVPVVVPTTHNDHKFCTKDGVFHEETWVVDSKSKGLKNVFVWLASADKDGKLAIYPSRQMIADADKKVVIDQPVCMFVPHALALREGQVVVVKNTSKVLHNFNWSGDGIVNLGGNNAIAAGQQQEVAIKAHRLPIAVNCGIHPWMKGWIRAFDHPYFAVTDAQGRFEIKDAPAGLCRLMIWHAEGWLGGVKGRDGKIITIQSGENDQGTLEFPPPTN